MRRPQSAYAMAQRTQDTSRKKSQIHERTGQVTILGVTYCLTTGHIIVVIHDQGTGQSGLDAARISLM